MTKLSKTKILAKRKEQKEQSVKRQLSNAQLAAQNAHLEAQMALLEEQIALLKSGEW